MNDVVLPEFDYIVVGGGSAGCVLAARLSESPAAQVLLLEAGGPERTREMRVPSAWPDNLGSASDWGYLTTSQADAGPVAYPRGRGLGGSGAINAMAHLRGHRVIYDGWAQNGAPGWGYADLLPENSRRRSKDCCRFRRPRRRTGWSNRVRCRARSCSIRRWTSSTMDALNRKVDGKTLLREQCYVCWMTPTAAAPPSGKTAADIRAQHFAYLLELERSGVLFAAGPFVDETGVRHGAGMLLIRAATRAEAETIAYAEPYTKAGMRQMTLTPWQRNEGALNLRIRFADGVVEIDNRTYTLAPPA